MSEIPNSTSKARSELDALQQAIDSPPDTIDQFHKWFESVAVAELPEHERIQQIDRAKTWLNIQSSNDIPQLLAWIRTFTILHELDAAQAEHYRDDLATRIRQGMDTAFRESPERHLEGYDRQARFLFRCIDLLPTAYLPLCLEVLRSLEDRLQAKPTEISDYMGQVLAASHAAAAEQDPLPVDKILKRRQTPASKVAADATESGKALASDLIDLALAGADRPDLKQSADGTWIYHQQATSALPESRWRMERFGGDLDSVILRTVPGDGLSRVLTVPAAQLFDAIEKGRMQDLIAVAIQNAEKEAAGQDLLDRYDLPKDRKAVHVRVFPKSLQKGFADDPVESTLMTSMILSATLRSRYGDRMALLPPLFSDDPAPELSSQVHAAYRQGIRHFVIDIFAHGDPDSLAFRAPLRMDVLMDLARACPEGSFTINTSACYGGGLVKSFLDDSNRDLQERIALFTQTKPDMVNLPASLATPSQMRESQADGVSPAATPRSREDFRRTSPGQRLRYGGTNYYIELIHGLLQGHGYGRACRDADRRSKRFGTDGDSVIHGQHVTTHSVPPEIQRRWA